MLGKIISMLDMLVAYATLCFKGPVTFKKVA